MQVVVLAGGIGSRLRPWTAGIPKPLLPMLDLTLLERVVEAVPVGMVDEVIVAGGYKVDLIESYFRSKDVDFDVRIVPEDEPLGTGGALGNCRDVVSGTFACFNGDIVSSLSIEPMLDLHRKNGGVGTLALWEVEDPTRFGIVGVNEDQRITRFKEKPKPEEVFSNLINAGSYIFQDDIFDWMPKGRHSIERDVFPKLAEENLLNGTEFEGYFIDAGTPDAWMDGVLRCIEEKRFSTGAVVDGSWHAKPKAFDTAHVQGCMIEADVTLQGCHIERSTLLSGVAVGFKSHLRNCLVGRGASVGSNVSMEGVVVDHGSTVPDGTSQVGGQWPKTEPSA
ncbi:MAG: NDP-sugar synthase [Candidatus Poseidoniaceae archaeon]|jgi:mannose-1-phosphate guanylyltransferase